MRRSIVLATLSLALIGAQAISAPARSVAAEEPAASTLSAICAFEFGKAETAALRDSGESTAHEGGSVIHALEVAAGSPDETVAAEEPVEAADEAGPGDTAAGETVGTALDATIRACASFAEWMTAARLFPGALRSLDPVATLTGRCGDPAADLGSFATCRSLVEALATPAPTPQPTRTPTAVAQDPPDTDAAAEQRDGEERDGAKRDGAKKRDGKAKRRPTKRSKQKVAVSKQHVARIPGATEIRYFKIRGETPAQLLRSNQRKGSQSCRNHQAIACVLLSWDISITKAADDSGRCIIGKADTTLTSIVYLPRWVDRKGAPADLVRWWRKVVLDSAVHERQHITIQAKHLAEFRRAAKGQPCGSATIIFNRHAKRANKAQAEFDEVEYRKPLPPLPASLLR